MLDDETRAHFAVLREKEYRKELTEAERNEYNGLVRRIEDEEAKILRPATEAVRRDRLRMEGENAALRALIRRQERLVGRLEKFLTSVEAEKRAIASERERIGVESLSSAGSAPADPSIIR